MKRAISFIRDLIFLLTFCTFLFTSMEIMPAVWGLLAYFSPDALQHLPDILGGFTLFILLLYVICVKKQTRISSYIYFLVLSIAIYVASARIDGPYNKMHLFEYFILSVLSFRIFHYFIYDARLYIIAVSICIVVGICDEFVQMFVASRAFDLLDLRSDIIAALFGQLFIFLVVRPDLDIWRSRLKKHIRHLSKHNSRASKF